MMKKLVMSALMLCMVFSLCACGNGGNDTEKDSEKESSQVENSEKDNSEKDTTASGKVHYTVKIVDENNKPIAGVLVQLCSDTCFPTSTNADGVAEWNLAEANYKASFLGGDTPAAGYTYSTDAKEFYFESGKTEMTIVLKAAS